MYSFWETKVKYGAYTMEVDFIKQVTWWEFTEVSDVQLIFATRRKD